MALTYPDLPCPAVGTSFRSAERRVLPPEGGPFDPRALQRDGLADVTLVFPPFSPAQAKTFDDWWRNDLRRGGAWFVAPWPSPSAVSEIVLRFTAPPRCEFIPAPKGGFWRFSAPAQLRGTGLPPRPPPFLGLHFNDNYLDVGGHQVGPYEYSPGITLPNFVPGKFGKKALRFSSFHQPVLTNVFGDFNLNSFGEWQLTCWVKLVTGLLLYAGKTVIQLIAGSTNGQTFPLDGGDGLQIQLSFVDDIVSGGMRPSFQYTTTNRVTDTLEPAELMPVIDGVYDAIPIDDDVWHFIAVCGDATSTRLYIDTDIAYDDHVVGATPPQPAGSRPVHANPLSLFTNQLFVIGAGFAGGRTISSPPWPADSVYSAQFGGDLQDLLIKVGKGCVDYTAAVIVPPAAPFSP